LSVLARLLPVAAGALAAAFAATGAFAAATPVTFTDTDTPALAAGTPDLTTVAVTNDDQAVYIGAGFAATPPTEYYAVLYVDSDQNGSTGNLDYDGVEYAFVYDSVDGSLNAYGWSAADKKFTSMSRNGATGITAAGVLVWLIPRSFLGSSPGLNFWTSASVDVDDATTLYDEAPNKGVWTYQLQQSSSTGGGTTAPAAEPFVLAPSKSSAGEAKAGSAWSASLEVVRSDTGDDLGKEGHATCAAKVGGASLSGGHGSFVTSGTGVFRHTSATCTWTLPKSAHGKFVVAVVSTTYKGAKAAHTYHAKVA
jgi:hypothetical protein